MKYHRSIVIISALIIATIAGIWIVSRQSMQQSEALIETLLIGTNAQYPPFTYIKNSQIVGFDIDLAREVAKRLGKKYEFVDMAFESLIPTLQSGAIHIIAAAFTPTIEREKRILFTTPYIENDVLVAVSKPEWHTIQTENDLNGKIVAVNQGYSSDIYASKLNGIEVLRLESPSIKAGLEALDEGKANLFIASQQALKPYLTNKNQTYSLFPLTDAKEPIALGVSKKYPELLSHTQSILNGMNNDGFIVRLKEKWHIKNQ